MTTTPPGWYDDGHGAMRWWDGSQWTEHVAQPDPEPSADAPTEAEIVAASEAESVAESAAASEATPEQQAYAAAGAAPQQVADAQPAPGAYPAQPGPAAYPPHPGDPAAYAAAHPGYAPGYPGGGFTAATEPRKSKLWILWLVLGLVLLGIVIAAAVLIPLLLMSAATSGASGGTDDERAAVEAVELYDEAWQDADCDAFESSTTEGFRESLGMSDCEVFVSEAELFDDSADDYEVRVDDVATSGDTITVSTTETYDALLDDAGEPLDTPEAGSVAYTYTLVVVDGEWVIDAVD